MNNLKILCVCRLGLYRSIETKRILNEKGYNNVLSVGGMLVSQKTLNLLCEWADKILLAKPSHGEKIDLKYKHKIDKKFHIGDDLTTTVKKALLRIGL